MSCGEHDHRDGGEDGRNDEHDETHAQQRLQGDDDDGQVSRDVQQALAVAVLDPRQLGLRDDLRARGAHAGRPSASDGHSFLWWIAMSRQSWRQPGYRVYPRTVPETAETPGTGALPATATGAAVLERLADR